MWEWRKQLPEKEQILGKCFKVRQNEEDAKDVLKCERSYPRKTFKRKSKYERNISRSDKKQTKNGAEIFQGRGRTFVYPSPHTHACKEYDSNFAGRSLEIIIPP